MLFIDQKLKAGKSARRSGPATKLSELEVLTTLVYDNLVEQHQTLRGIYNYIRRLTNQPNKASRPSLMPKNKIATEDKLLLSQRSLVKSAFGVLKTKYKLVTSYASYQVGIAATLFAHLARLLSEQDYCQDDLTCDERHNLKGSEFKISLTSLFKCLLIEKLASC